MTMSHSTSQSDLKRGSACDWPRTIPRRPREHRVPSVPRGGMTLLELLVVVGVMVILLALALPIMKTGLEGRQTREASRQLSTYIELAKAHAAETGRPAGLQLVTETLPEADVAENVRFASRLYLTETPLPYVGDVIHATVQVAQDNSSSPPTWKLTFGTDSLSLPYIGVTPGDRIRFGFKGPAYEISTVSWTPTYNAWINASTDFPMPPNGTYSYQIYRKPERSSSMPLELATGAVVDLEYSGFALLGTQFAASDPTTGGSVSIIFDPSGSVAYAIIDGVRWEQTDTIHLLVGRIDELMRDDITTDPEGNLANPDSRWVSIGHQAGKVTVAENGGTEANTALDVCREFAQSAQSMGGR